MALDLLRPFYVVVALVGESWNSLSVELGALARLVA
jgi:hypothetical protein